MFHRICRRVSIGVLAITIALWIASYWNIWVLLFGKFDNSGQLLISAEFFTEFFNSFCLMLVQLALQIRIWRCNRCRTFRAYAAYIAG